MILSVRGIDSRKTNNDAYSSTRRTEFISSAVWDFQYSANSGGSGVARETSECLVPGKSANDESLARDEGGGSNQHLQDATYKGVHYA